MLPESTRIGGVRLRVASLDRALELYEGVLGLRAVRSNGRARLFVNGASHAIIELNENAAAVRSPARASGLYHMAILLPTRRQLGRVLRRLAAAGWALQGGSDHLVSEALYLADPDGNGIELYADRPREKWPRTDGEIAMATLQLDVDGLLAEADAPAEPWRGLPAGTVMGHVHLRVPSIEEGEMLFVRVIGFDITTRQYPGALFMSAGGYHHHVAVNVWQGRDVPPLPGNAAGLLDFEIIVPDKEEIETIASRARAEGVRADPDPDGVVLVHAGEIRVCIRWRQSL